MEIIKQRWFQESIAIATAALDSGNPKAIQRADTQIVGNMVRFIIRQSTQRETDHENLLDFLLGIGANAHNSRAQLCQDMFALWESGMKTGGYFVEFGGIDGVLLSNTYALEKYHGWTGIVAEPNPAMWPALQGNRTCYTSNKCVFSTSGDKVPFSVTPNSEFSRMAGLNPDDRIEAAGLRDNAHEVLVETITLNDLLDEAGAPREIDFLSVDTEGSELSILEAVDFDRWRFNAIAVEHNKTPAREKIFTLLTGNGYRRKWEYMSAIDDWYVPA